MENIIVQKRDLTVKAKKMRRLGLVPGSVSGKSFPASISIQMEESVARRLIREKREGSKISLDIEGQVVPAQIKEKTLDTLNNKILDISFQELVSDEKINSVIHILTVNDKIFEGQLQKMVMEIPYSSFPGDMIDTITIDVDGLKIGDIITVKDIPELNSDKIECHIDPDEIVMRISERHQNAEVAPEE